jgi:integrase
MRRGEVVGLKWSDLDLATKRLSIQRTPQRVAGQPVEFGVKIRTSRRCFDLDQAPSASSSGGDDGCAATDFPCDGGDWMFCNTASRFLNPESLSQLFARIVKRSPVPAIRLHDCDTPHASLLIAAGVPIKVVSERLGPLRPRVHDEDLPARDARHERRRGRPVRHPHRYRHPVDVDQRHRRETPGHRLGASGAGRRRR